MLENMRNQAQSWMAKLILAGIALSFALWGIGDYFFGSRIQPVAEIDGKPIGQNTFLQAYERQMNRYRTLLGANFTKDMAESMHLKQNTLDALINRALIVEEATKLGLRVPESAMASRIRANPAFASEAGTFDPQRYRILTRNMGFASPQDYESQLQLDMLIDTLRQAITGSVRVGMEEVRERFNRMNEQRILAAIIIDPEQFVDKMEISDAEAHAWYESHLDSYQAPLRIRLRMVDINPEDFARDLAIDEQDIAKAYEQRKNEFFQPEKRRARHILIKVASDASPEVKNAAKQKAEGVLARLKAGEDFAKLASEVSEDTTAKQGGDLGWFVQGSMVPAFDKAVFSMHKGEISDIIETRFGFHIIRLDDIQPAGIQPLESVRQQIIDALRRERAADEAYKLSQDLDDALGMEGSLAAAAKSLNLKVHEIGPISQDEALAQPLLRNPELRGKIFATLPDQPVEIIETSNGHFVAFEVVERLDPAPLAYEKVVAKVMEDAKRAKAREKAEALAHSMLDKTPGKDPKALAQQFAQPLYVSKPVKLNGAGDSSPWLTQDLLQQAFSASAGQWIPAVHEVPQGLALVHCEQIIAPPDEEFARQQKRIAEEVKRYKGAVRFDQWLRTLRARHDVRIHAKALEQF